MIDFGGIDQIYFLNLLIEDGFGGSQGEIIPVYDDAYVGDPAVVIFVEYFHNNNNRWEGG